MRSRPPSGRLHEEPRLTIAPLNRAYAVFLWLSLAVVLVPALGWSGSPLTRTQGSAFNAFTSDVSLGPRRAAPPEKADRRQSLSDGGSDGSGGYAQVALVPAPSPTQVRRLADGTAFPDVADIGPARFSARGFQARAPPSL